MKRLARISLWVDREAFRQDAPFARTTAEGHSLLDMMAVALGYDIRKLRKPTLSAGALRVRAMAEREAEHKLRAFGVKGRIQHEYRNPEGSVSFGELVSTGEVP